MTLILDSNYIQKYSFRELKWDTEFFGVSCAKAILFQSLDRNQWEKLKTEFNKYQFVSIENRNSMPANAHLIGKDTSAFLADVNIQFERKPNNNCIKPDGIVIHRSMESNNQVLDLADFSFSKFIEDPELNKRGGPNVYRQWVMNAFKKQDKFFALARNEGIISGFLLHSYSEKTCTVELIAVSSKFTDSGIGTALMKAVEYEALYRGCDLLRVGTQVRNNRAVNFYQKYGFRQVSCNQIYHLWNNKGLDI